MNRQDGALLLATARNNKLKVALHTVAGVALVGSSIGFSTMIALYFGFDVFGAKDRPPFDILASNKTLAITAAILCALLALIARVGQTVIEATVTIDRERWFAEELRASPAAKQIAGNIVRASNYYGRLSTASMRAVSIIGVLALNLVGLTIALPNHYATAGVLLILLCSIGLYAIMRTLASKMADATDGLFANVKALGTWKTNGAQSATDEVERYYKSYYNRIFLASTFSFTSLFFAFALSLVILLLHELNVLNIDFGELFIAFTLLQAYLGLVGNFFGALVQGAAFLPAVKPYSGFVAGFSPGSKDQNHVGAKAYLNGDPALEATSLEDL
jgi:hypothetical protein